MKTITKFALCLIAACGLTISAAAQDVISTVIGGGPNGIPGVNANMNEPYQLAIDASGNIYIASYGMNRVFKITTAGVETVLAGTGIAGYSGDGGPAVIAKLYTPESVAVDSASPPNVYIADFNNCLVRKVNQSTGIITTVAGYINSSGNPVCGYNGDGEAANAAEIYGPAGVAVNPATSDLYIADYYNGIVRKVAGGSPSGTITTVAGTPQQNCQGTAPYGDTGTAVAAHLCYPDAVSLDTASPPNLYISEYNRCTLREVVGSSKDIYQIAGSYSLGCGYSGDGTNAVGAQLYQPYQTHASISGSTTTVEVADFANARVRQFTLTYSSAVPKPGNISTIAGKGENGWCNDDGGSALSACMGPVGIVYDSSGNYYLGDWGASRIRKVTKSTNLISTIFGWGPNGSTEPYFSDPVGIKGVTGGTPSLYYPIGVYADPTSSNVYVAGYDGEAVYQWNSSTNQITGFAGSGYPGFAGDGSAASSTATELNTPYGVGKDSKGNIYIADYNNCAIREVVAASGDITTVVGGSPGSLKGCGYVNTGGVSSQLNGPTGVAFDSANNMYISDYNNCAIRKLSASTGLVSTIAGVGPPSASCGYSGDGGPATSSQIFYPLSIALDGAGNIYFSEANGQYGCRIREIVASSGIIQTVAGDGSCGYTGDGPATGNSIYSGYVTSDPNGNLFLADYYNQIARWVTPSGQMITFAGSYGASAGYSGDGSSALKATFYYPAGIARDSSGNIYVADEYNYRVRRITPFAGYGLSTGSLLFETQPAGTVSDFQPVTVSAIGPTTISAITTTAGYSEIDDCVGQSLTANQTCEIDVYFQPTAAGKVSGSLTITSNALLAGNPNKIVLNGTASGLTLTGAEAFGNVPLKNPSPQTLTLTNSGAAVTLTKIYLTSTTAFSITGGTCPTAGGPLASKASCTIIVSFNPQTVGAFKSTLVVASNDPASPLLAQVTGTGTEVKLSASSISFGSISFGTTSTFDLTITNTGTAAFTLAETISGAGFSISSTGKTCTTSVAAGASCVLPVEYDPTAIGTNSGTLTLSTNGGSSPVIPLTGTCTSDVTVSPTTLAFGTITHATAKVLNVTVSNVGTISSLTVSTSISGTGLAAFSVLSTGNTCGSGVAPGKTCTLPVQFEDATVGSYSATLTVSTNGGQNPTVTLTGTTD